MTGPQHSGLCMGWKARKTIEAKRPMALFALAIFGGASGGPRSPEQRAGRKEESIDGHRRRRVFKPSAPSMDGRSFLRRFPNWLALPVFAQPIERPRNPELLHLGNQRGPLQSEPGCGSIGATIDPTGGLQCPQDQGSLGVLESALTIGCSRGA